ncbi:hypothetical protein SerAS12_2706 [Serratia sp. AS12]|uniref:hypothetical protein n=1 Tax=Serratia TaxID=613 RepID=UPI00020EA0BA|nr:MULTISPECIES: hypothetical protein [Serratia]AEF45826.1 hypothetical protein SerAS9_2705 [Serratia plymuthica AS9]AEF50777.1 hypothetical protein SerAS12_2706 [Serratia sp. AS12]AEG28484.1 hypothetical protein SerAS13_2707 [Serratia sp. AS13]UTN94584.1 hypothetical protein NLX81_13790 [Serratia plymuthica]
MIYLLSSADSNDILEISDWDEIIRRPNFAENVDLRDKNLHRIIGSYELKDKRSCGITSCHKPHNKGFIVVTDDDVETNIGNDCGFKYFNVKFNDMTQEFLRNLTNEQRKLALFKAYDRVDGWRQQADKLKVGEKNIDWAISLINDIKNPLVIGRYASTELKRMAAVPTNLVTVPRLATSKEADIQELFDKKYSEREEQTVDEPIGVIEHIDSLTSQHDLKSIFYMSVTKVLRELAACNPTRMSSPAMSALLRKVDLVDFNLKLAEERLLIARQFLTTKNLHAMYEKMFQMDVVSRADLKRYESFINGLK